MADIRHWPQFAWQCPECFSSDLSISAENLQCQHCQAAFPVSVVAGKTMVDFVRAADDANQRANLEKYSGNRSEIFKQKIKNSSAKRLKLEYTLKRLARFKLQDQLILDIGGGEGIIPGFWYQEHPVAVVGLDLARANVVARCQDTPLPYNVVGNMLKLPFCDNTFDAGIFFASLHHVPDPQKALQEAWRVIKPGGTLLLFEPLSLKLLFSRQKFKPADAVEYAFAASYVLNLLKKVGFKRIAFSSHGLFSKIVDRAFLPMALQKILFGISCLMGRVPFVKYLCFEGFVSSVKPS